MDTIAKVGDGRYELGELKRIVNTVLQGLDFLTDDVVTIAATNYPHLLDTRSGDVFLTRRRSTCRTATSAKNIGCVFSTKEKTSGAMRHADGAGLRRLERR